jgi:hypothetical protein
MSQYLSFKLVNKTNPSVKVDLGYWCTSIARGICSNFYNIFHYTEKDIKLSIEKLKDYIKILNEGIDEYRKHLREAQEKKKEYTELLLKAQSVVVINSIKEDINSYEYSITDWQDEIDCWLMVESKLNFILNILEENKENWDLEYRNS